MTSITHLKEHLPTRTIAVAGLGLLGGSICMACKKLLPDFAVLGYARRAETVAEALERGVIDSGSSDPREVLPKAGLTIVCMPIDATIKFCRDHAALWRKGALVTDVGSIKADIVRDIQPHLARYGVNFMGSHPMAGAETSGLDHALPELYEGAVVFLTPQENDSKETAQALEAFWNALGSRVEYMDSDSHDKLVAGTSHALHLVAGTAATTILQHPKAGLGTAGGFRDFTRIASAAPSMWIDIFKHNRQNVVDVLDKLMLEQQKIRDILQAADWDGVERFLQDSKEKRDAWLEQWQEARRNSNE